MTAVAVGASASFNASINGQTFVVSTNGGYANVTVSGSVADPLGPAPVRKVYGPFAVGQGIGIVSISAEIQVEASQVPGSAPVPNVTSSVKAVVLPSRAAALVQAPVFISSGRAVVGRKPVSYVPLDPRVEATQYYVDITNGSDANTGLSWAQAYKSIWKATTSGNAGAVPFAVNIAAGRYSRANNFANASATVIPTQSCVFRAVGGQVECHTGGTLTWALDTGTTYSVARSNVVRVLDWLNVDDDGDYVEITKVTALATCRATPGTWYTDGTTVYVNRSDAAAVTDTNTTALLTAVDGIEFTTTGSMHLYGITQIGGTNGALRLQNNVTGKFYAEDCKFSFSTGPNGSPVDNVTGLNCGLVVMNRCVSSKGQKDGFNYHTKSASIPQVIHFDCMGYGNGVDQTSTSNNGATIHDAGLLIDFNGRYYKNWGGDFAHANASTVAVGVCTHTFGSYGDLARSGGVVPPGVGFQSVAGAYVYKYDCIGMDLYTGSGGLIVNA